MLIINYISIRILSRPHCESNFTQELYETTSPRHTHVTSCAILKQNLKKGDLVYLGKMLVEGRVHLDPKVLKLDLHVFVE